MRVDERKGRKDQGQWERHKESKARKILVKYVVGFWFLAVCLAGSSGWVWGQSAEFWSELRATKLKMGHQGYNKLRNMVPRMGAAAAAKNFKAGKMILVDAQTLKGYQNEHILGAISVPWDLVDGMKRLPIHKSFMLGTYCP